MLISDLIMYIDDQFNNAFDDATKIDIINEMEQRIYSKTIEEIDKVAFNLTLGVENYPIVEPRIFEEIIQLEVSNVQYYLTNINDSYVNSFFKESNGISLNPIPYADVVGGMIVYFRRKPTIKTKANINVDTPAVITDFGIRWKPLYHYYVAWKLSVLLKENEEANNWAVLYNEKESELFDWYTSRQANNVANDTKSRW